MLLFPHGLGARSDVFHVLHVSLRHEVLVVAVEEVVVVEVAEDTRLI